MKLFCKVFHFNCLQEEEESLHVGATEEYYEEVMDVDEVKGEEGLLN